MSDLSNTWVLWLILTTLIVGGLVYRRKEHKASGNLYNTPEDFSVKNILFSFTKGEADLFFGYTFAIIFFALFLIGIVHWVQQMS